MVSTIDKATAGLHRSLAPVTLVLALAMTGGYATDASAACPGPPALASPNAGPFYIEGVVGDTNGNACNNSGLAPGAAKVVDPAGNTKELGPVNGSNTKVNNINTATPPMLEFTNPNGQTDLNTIYTQSGVAAGDLWYYFGWARDSNSGSGFISVELEKSGVPNGCVYTAAGIDMIQPQSAAETALINSCNPWSGRSGDGTPQGSDFMILWDQSGNSKDIYVRYFNSAAGKFGVAQLLNGSIAVAEYSTDLFRGEVAIDLTAVVGGNPTACLTFANIIPGTVTGNSDTADYKDTVLAPFPIASNCGVLNVKKITLDPNGTAFVGTGTFRYTLNRTGGGNIRFSAPTPPDNNPCTSPACVETLATSTRTLTAGNQTRTHVDLIVGSDYSLAENTALLGTEWQFKNITCAVGTAYPTPDSSTSNPLTSIQVQSSATTWCVIVNQRVKTAPSETSLPAARVFLFDSISITGIAPTASPAQNVTFSLWTVNTCSGAANKIGADVTAAISYTGGGTSGTANTANVSGHNGIEVAAPFNGSTYYWQVSYPGDLLNKPFNTCGAAPTDGVLLTPTESSTVSINHSF